LSAQPDQARIQEGLQRLVSQLEASSALPSPEWKAIVGRVQRHRFVPRWYEWDGDEPTEHLGVDDVERWLARSYADDVMAIDPRPEHRSSSSQPSMMLAFLAALDLRPGDKVLEIGTGSGYNAALLCERVGSHDVTTIDIEPHLVRDAAQRLAECGYQPTVVCADGAQGYASRAPYDRIIATCSVPRIPEAWLDQLTADGVLVTPLGGGRFEYGLIRLQRCSDGSFQGRLRVEGANFMRLRRPGQRMPPDEEAARSLIEGVQGSSTRLCRVPPLLSYVSRATWGLRFMINAVVQDVAWLWRGPDPEWGSWDGERRREFPAVVSWLDRSWAIVSRNDRGELIATQGGSRRLWDLVEACAEEYAKQGEPTHLRYGITITPDRRQWLWLDHPGSEHRWEL